MPGWIKLHREIVDHWIFKDDAMFKRWVDLLMLAGFEKNKTFISGHLVIVDRGQLIWSHAKLSERWKCSIQTVRTFLKNLENDNMITRDFVQKSNSKITVITICNYYKYQETTESNQQLANSRATASQQLANSRATASQQLDHQEEEIQELKEVKEQKEVKKEYISAAAQKTPKTTEKLLLMDCGVDEDLADDFLILRKSKRSPITKTVCKTIANEANKAGIGFSQAIEICIARSWQSFNASWDWQDKRQINGSRFKTSDEIRQENTAKAKKAFLASFKTIDGEVL